MSTYYAADIGATTVYETAVALPSSFYGRKWTSFTEVKQFAGIHTANTGQREAMDSNLKPMLFTKTLIISTQLKNKFYNADKLWNCMNLYSISSRNKKQSYLNVLIIYNFYK